MDVPQNTNMNEMHRREKFEQEYQKLVEKYGMTIHFDVQCRRLGQQYQLEPVVSIVPVDGWQALEVTDDDSEDDDDGSDRKNT
ncbi:hypothetical protein KAR91_21840 [Candidatus Pacearchaeota archaeon]|nr:hypothetical protein [Candidatus Pacearchaeota archaeon]